MSWPEAAVGIVGIICFASVLLGRWPWTQDVYTCDCCQEDDEEST